MEEVPPKLRAQLPDHAATALQFITGAVGGPAGAFFGAMIGHWIPGQLQERLVRYVAALRRSLDRMGIDYAHLEGRMGAVEIDLFNLGAQVAAQSRTEQRIAQIAEIVATGMDGDQVRAADAERMVRLLADVTEADVTALCALSPTYYMADKWRTRHPRAHAIYLRHATGVVRPSRTIAAPEPTAQERELEVMIDFQLRRLQALGLLDREPGKIPYGGAPPKPGPFQLTPLAAHVLDRLGVTHPADPQDRLRPVGGASDGI